ncbi:MAG TPA: FKBP-type peptidyl-prolyl cis-trans isomerase [Acidimicrobiales bacterium]|nr:FKBP-type peptidyl-prolyl cis-trans isomerase [Acidimicrobiales bacterium]
MATAKRERQKAARRQKIEQMQREAKRRRTIRRSVIVGVVAIAIVISAAYLFSGSSTPTTTTTTSAAAPTTTVKSTATTIPSHFAKVASPSPAGTFGKPPTVVVPAGNPPKVMEVSDLIDGGGKPAMIGSKVTVQYVLATYSTRKVIQSSWTSSPFSFTIGAGQVIKGWDEGIVGMHVGGRRELIIPPSLGYGAQSPGAGIAKNDTLVFVVDLLKVS